MKIEYSPDENDFLIHQLYIATKSNRIKKKRWRNRFIVPLFYLFFALSFFYNDNNRMVIVFSILAVLWFLIYPFWEKGHYVRHYKGFIKDSYKARIGKPCTIQFEKDHILTSIEGAESRFEINQIEQIDEIPSMILVKLKVVGHLILPKDTIANIDEVRDMLKGLGRKMNINYNIDNKWEWK